MPANPDSVRDVFLSAVALPAPDRPGYLARACAGDPELRAAVDRLLAGDAAPAGLLQDNSPGLPRTGDYHPAPDDTGAVLAGRYKLLEQIGEGGMGTVWVAHQTEPVKRTVAIKLIKRGMDSHAVLARFEAERQALALMDHPNIAKVLDAGATPDGRPFFVMELVRGMPITKFCDTRRLTPRERLEMFVPVCHAVQHAHQKGVIHRDIKPGNVLVAVYDDRPVPKIIDFGVAKATTRPLTEQTLHTAFGTVIGTPQYMSPEQATFNNLDVDTRSDLYSLGVLLYELLTGSPPFTSAELQRAGIDEMLRVVREKEPPRPSEKLSTAAALPSLAASRSTEPKKLTGMLRSELDWVVMKALEKDRTRRYETANGFAADVLRYLSGEPVEAVPPSPVYRLRKLYRRNKAAARVMLLVFAILTAGIVGTTGGMFRAEQARRLADALHETAEEAKADAQTQAALARQEAANAQASATAARAESLKVQHLLALRHARDGVKLADEGRLGMGALAMAHALVVAPDAPGAAAAARVRLGLYRRYMPASYRTGLFLPQGYVGPALYSPDGTRILTAELSYRPALSARLWDAESGALLKELPHPAGVLSAAFAPDGRSVVTGCLDGVVRIWDVRSGLPLVTLPAAGGRVVAFSPDGRQLLTVSDDLPARLWDVGKWDAPRFQLQHPGQIWAAKFAPDGRHVLTAGWDRVPRLWDTSAGKEPFQLPPQSAAVLTVAFSPDGQMFATGCADGATSVWDAGTGRRVSKFPFHTGSVQAIAFSPDGNRIVTGSDDHTAHVWNPHTGERVFAPLVHGDLVWGVAFAPDGRRVATGCREGTARVWDARTGDPVSAWLQHADHLGSVSFARDGRRLLTGAADTRVWEVTGNEYRPAPATPVIPPGRPNMDFPDPTVLSADGRWAALGSRDGTVQVIEVASGKVLGKSLSLADQPLALALSADGRRVLIGCRSGLFAIWEPANGKPPVFLKRFPGSVTGVALSPDGRTALTCGWPGPDNARLWDAETGQPLGPPLSAARDATAAAFSADGRRFALGSSAKSGTTLWDAPTRTVIATIAHDTPVLFVLFSPDSRRLFVATEGKRSDIADAETGRPLSTIRHDAWLLNGAAFSPDGSRLATAHGGEIARVWDVPTGAAVTPPLLHVGAVTTVSFSPDGRWVLAGSSDHTARLWDAATGIPVSPHFFHADGVQFAGFAADGRTALTRAARPEIVKWDLTPDERPVSEIIESVQALSGHRIDDTGATVAILPSDYAAVWSRVRVRESEPPVRPETIYKWREREIRDSLTEGNLRAVRFHCSEMFREVVSEKAK
ncbi:protein kinase domain-containing protein [Fimbriiglobus ruber]|uniref:High-affnity carbon uptake protein Hat/HatR n=1 Tax=Fimbriiglobus ruber TaxID=1908690 RepID=A0A225D7M9_9BACT|nr:protein kinase [Fimbriiglobus ruber]OWK37610.1 High-affnity carbon uptake protein Hat/HatR [Fimbriiglobus ruber]